MTNCTSAYALQKAKFDHFNTCSIASIYYKWSVACFIYCKFERNQNLDSQFHAKNYDFKLITTLPFTLHLSLSLSVSFIIGYIEVSNMNVTFGRKVREHQWLDLVKHYWAILLVIFVAALIIVLMPIIG